jgi:exosortase
MLIPLAIIFEGAAENLYYNVTRENSYYSHCFVVPFVSLFFVWSQRNYLSQLPKAPTNWGYAVLAFACSLVIFGELLGFRILSQLAVIPLMASLGLIFFGVRHVAHLWFPLAFLLFMIPLPESLTTGITFRVKLIAAEGAVSLCNLVYLPTIRDGSYIHIGSDRLLVGDVCGGMRSLISLMALGTIMSYISETRNYARVLVLLIAAPIAILSNLLRIFFLCAVAHFWDSSVATGWVHDASGVGVYALALSLLIGVEALLRKVAPKGEKRVTEPSNV